MDCSYKYKLYRSIDEVDAGDWNKVCQNSGEDLFMDLRFISSVELTMSQTARFWHVIFYDNENAPVACTSLCRFNVDPFILTGGYINKAGKFFRRVFPSFPVFNILFCGLPVSVGQSHLRLTPEADQDCVMKMLDQILGELAGSERSWCIVFKEFDPESCKRMDSLIKLGYLKGESLPMHNFPPRFSDFAGYYSALRPRYRKSIRRSMRKFNSSGLKIVRVTDTGQIQQIYDREVHKLYEAVVSHSEHKLEILPLEFFHELARRFPGQISCTFIYQDDRVVAFNWALYSQASYNFLFGGLNYELNHSADIYFNRMYNALDNALQHGSPVIQLGQTADKFKAGLGCFQQSRYVYIKGASKLSHYLLQLFFNMFFPSQKRLVPDKDPFKQETRISCDY